MMSYQAWALMRLAIVPKFQTTSASLVSQLVAGLDALMSSAWFVQRTHAINGIRSSTREMLSRSRSQTRRGGLDPRDQYSNSGTIQKIALVTLTTIASVPRTMASAAKRFWRLSIQIIPTQTYETENAVAMYSIVDDRPHQILNGDSRKTRSAITAAVRVERWRTSPHSANAVAMKQISPLARSAR